MRCKGREGHHREEVFYADFGVFIVECYAVISGDKEDRKVHFSVRESSLMHLQPKKALLFQGGKKVMHY